MRKTEFVLLFLLINLMCFSQMKKLTGENWLFEEDIYYDNNGTRYSKLINIKFNNNITSMEKGKRWGDKSILKESS